MKKLLSILGVCGLVGMSANLTACNKPNNNENGGGNKPDKPPVGSNWKLINDPESEILDKDKTYIVIAGSKEKGYYLADWKKFDWKVYKYKSVYRWDGVGEPKTFEIDN
ncbi:lipoprotein, partial [Spiroplasma melliferum]